MNYSKVLFINTFEPVVPLYRDVIPLIKQVGMRPMALISECQYRGDEEGLDRQYAKLVWVPTFLKKRRRWCAVLYYIAVPFHLITIAADTKIVFLSQPPLFYILGAAISRWRGMPYYLHVMDLYPDLLVRLGRFKAGLLLRWILSASEKAFRKAEKVIVIGRCMEAVIRDKGVSADNIVVIENWPEHLPESQYDYGRKFRIQWNLADKFVVMYSGNMGNFHSFDTILRVARKLEGRRDIAFVFIGQGSRRCEIEQAILGGAKNILLLEYQPVEQFANVLNVGDIHFVSLRDGCEGLMVPSKLYGILAAARPVIYEGNKEGEVARVVDEEKCGEVIDPGDVCLLERVLLQYLESAGKSLEEGKKARLAYEKRFNRDAQAKRYVDLLLG